MEATTMDVKVPLRIRLYAGDVEVAETQDVPLWLHVLKVCVTEDAALASTQQESGA